MQRRDFLLGGSLIASLGGCSTAKGADTRTSASVDVGSGPLSAIIEYQGDTYRYEEMAGASLGDYVDPHKRFIQGCIRTTHDLFPLTVFFRRDRGSNHAEAVFSRRARSSCCRFPISTSCSRCPHRSPRSRSTTRQRSTPFYSAQRRRRCAVLPPMLATSAPRSARSRCCIPGDRRCTRTLTHDTWHWTKPLRGSSLIRSTHSRLGRFRLVAAAEHLTLV